jgi:hypothetical protein
VVHRGCRLLLLLATAREVGFVTRTGASFLAGLLLPAATAGAIEVGQPAPDFTRQDLSGMSHTLSALRGKAVLLAFVGHG